MPWNVCLDFLQCLNCCIPSCPRVRYKVDTFSVRCMSTSKRKDGLNSLQRAHEHKPVLEISLQHILERPVFCSIPKVARVKTNFFHFSVDKGVDVKRFCDDKPCEFVLIAFRFFDVPLVVLKSSAHLLHFVHSVDDLALEIAKESAFFTQEDELRLRELVPAVFLVVFFDVFVSSNFPSCWLDIIIYFLFF